MGLTSQSTGVSAIDRELRIERICTDDKIIALAGNPMLVKALYLTIFPA